MISFIIPVFQNELTIDQTFAEVQRLIKESVGIAYEFIFINDGSTDDSWNRIQKLSQIHPEVSGISFSRNFGQVPAINAGLNLCKGDAAIVLSADLQDPPEMILKLLDAWQNGEEIVIAYRIAREDRWTSRLVSSIFYRSIRAAIPSMPAGGFDFVLLGRKAINAYNQLKSKNRFFQGDVLWLGYPTKMLPYKRVARTKGKSQWTIKRKLKYFIDAWLNSSYLPIRLMSLSGVITAFAGFIYAMVVVYARMINHVPFKGYAPIVILILLIGGLVMIMLGIIGEYLWRILDEVKTKPEYIISEYSGFEDPSSGTEKIK
ncbi:MAG: glycosyltransferase [Bacteroidetes bacterium]|nr:glycosyltransferase [Bacteroidota bacterium]